MGDTGFHLGAGLYFGFDGHHHGEWRGELHVDGEHIADCTEPGPRDGFHQIRDAVMRVDDRSAAAGWGNLQTDHRRRVARSRPRRGIVLRLTRRGALSAVSARIRIVRNVRRMTRPTNGETNVQYRASPRGLSSSVAAVRAS